MNVSTVSTVTQADAGVTGKKKSVVKKIKRDKWMLAMMLPGILVFILFKYVPMFGLVVAFQDFKPYLGFLHSPFVGFQHFITFFTDESFFRLFYNTLIFGILGLVFAFPLPIIVALMLNEIRANWYKRTIQTFIYIPHFISWVVVAALTVTFFGTQDGVVNSFLGTHTNFLANPGTFRAEIILQQIWKGTGWGTIIYLAALSGVDPSLYEAARIDGANRRQQMWHVTLPAIRGTIVILLILHMGSFLNIGFEQLLLMLNPLVQKIGDVYETYVYDIGITNGQLSYSTAVGLFKSLVSLILILLTNKISKWLGEEGLF